MAQDEFMTLVVEGDKVVECKKPSGGFRDILRESLFGSAPGQEDVATTLTRLGREGWEIVNPPASIATAGTTATRYAILLRRSKQTQ